MSFVLQARTSCWRNMCCWWGWCACQQPRGGSKDSRFESSFFASHSGYCHGKRGKRGVLQCTWRELWRVRNAHALWARMVFTGNSNGSLLTTWVFPNKYSYYKSITWRMRIKKSRLKMTTWLLICISNETKNCSELRKINSCRVHISLMISIRIYKFSDYVSHWFKL